MKGFVKTGGCIEIQISHSSNAFTNAAVILQRRLKNQVDMTVHIIENNISRPGNSCKLLLLLATLETLPDILGQRLDPPVTILPYPDYAERVNLRILVEEDIPSIVLIAGSEKALIYGIGKMLKGMRVESDSLVWEFDSINYEPLTPLRGFVFVENGGAGGYANLSREQWDDLLSELALWGNNLIGFNPDCFPSWLGECCKKHSFDLNYIIKSDCPIPRDLSASFFTLSRRKTKQSIDSFYDWAEKIAAAICAERGKTEFWLDCDDLADDELTILFARLVMEKEPFVQSIQYGPNGVFFETVKREAPLTIQLISVNRMSETNANLSTSLAERYLDYAPLTYGALGLTSEIGDFNRLRTWSMLSWSPQMIDNNRASYKNDCCAFNVSSRSPGGDTEGG